MSTPDEAALFADFVAWRERQERKAPRWQRPSTMASRRAAQTPEDIAKAQAPRVVAVTADRLQLGVGHEGSRHHQPMRFEKQTIYLDARDPRKHWTKDRNGRFVLHKERDETPPPRDCGVLPKRPPRSPLDTVPAETCTLLT